MKLLSTEIKNKVIASMAAILRKRKTDIIAANQKDLDAFPNKDDHAMYDRLIVNDSKIDGMVKALDEVMAFPDPVGIVKSERILVNGLKIQNKTAPFGNILIIYESRPDVTVEAAVLTFKANSKILLKGGKEAKFSNEILVECWHQALAEHGLDSSWVRMLKMNREETQAFLKKPDQKLDLIVPRGGEKLIAFVKQYAECPVLVSGRGNNFMYIADDADWQKTMSVAINSKTHKISACNALDKVLIDKNVHQLDEKIKALQAELNAKKVEILVDESSQSYFKDAQIVQDESVWYEEFLALKACFSMVDNQNEAVDKINKYSGGHSAIIMTEDATKAQEFMEQVDSAAVYHNASTRFTDGGAMGVGAELAISTDKLHHRGPLGLEQLVCNKYYVFGNGHIRE